MGPIETLPAGILLNGAVSIGAVPTGAVPVPVGGKIPDADADGGGPNAGNPDCDY